MYQFCFMTPSKHQKINIIIKPLKNEDYAVMAGIINSFAGQGLMLPKTVKQLKSLAKYIVAKENKKIIGGVGLKRWSNNLVELVSLAILPRYHGRGLGSLLINKAMTQAKKMGYKTIFTLTLRPSIFEKLGMNRAAIKSFPQKIWGDCKNCPKNAKGPDDAKCDEIALVKNFDENN